MSDQKIWTFIKDESPRPSYNEIIEKFKNTTHLPIAIQYWLILYKGSWDDILLEVNPENQRYLYLYTNNRPNDFINNIALQTKIEKEFALQKKKVEIITSNIECQYINIRLLVSYNLNLDQNAMYALFDKLKLNKEIPFCKLVDQSNTYYKIHRDSEKDIPLQTICYQCERKNIPIIYNTIGTGWICEQCWTLYNKPLLELKQESKTEARFIDQSVVNPWRDLPNFNVSCKDPTNCAFSFPCIKKQCKPKYLQLKMYKYKDPIDKLSYQIRLDITDDYTNIFLVENKDNSLDLYTSFTNKDSITIHRIKERLSALTPLLIGKMNNPVSILTLNGTIYIPRKHYTFYILQDLIMNDYFKRPNLFLVEKETIATNNTKKTFSNTLKIRFYRKNGFISATISSSKRKKGDDLKKSIIDFPFGEYYTTIQISRNSKNLSIPIINAFIVRLNKLFQDYTQYYSRIREEYDIPILTETTKPVKLNLSRYVPDLYMGTTTVQKSFAPTVLTEAEAKTKFNTEELKTAKTGDNPSLLQYPLENKKNFFKEREIKYDYTFIHKSLTDPTLYFDCKSTPYNNKFVGLVLVRDKYAPKCFPVNQLKKNIYMQHYYKNKSINREAHSIPFTQCNTVELFDNTIQRYIPPYTPNSILSCLNRATGKNLKRKDIIQSLKQPELFAYSKQELYNFNTVNDILQYLNKPTHFIDASLFIRLLEQLYDVNLYIFKQSIVKYHSILIPNHIQTYYTYKSPKRPNIILYEYWKRTQYFVNYPNYSLLIDKKTGSPSYTASNPILVYIRNWFSNLNNTYNGFAIVKECFMLPFIPLIRNQWIDRYGKARIFTITFKNSTFSIITSPLPPLIKPYIKIYALLPATNFIALTFMNTYCNSITRYPNKIEGSLKEGGLNITIHLDTHSYLSSISTYSKNKALSLYIVQNAIYLYSKELINNSNLTFSQFFKEFINIVPEEYTYKIKTPYYSGHNGIILNNKLNLTNKMLHKLKYILTLVIKFNLNRLKTFYKKYDNKLFLTDYSLPSDFNNSTQDVILYSKDQYTNYIQDHHTFITSLKTNTYSPTFLKYKNEMYLSYPQPTLNDSLQVSHHWDEYQSIPISLNPNFKNKTNFILNKSIETTDFKQTNKNIQVIKNLNAYAPLLSDHSVNTIRVLTYNIHNKGMQSDRVIHNNKKIIQKNAPYDFIGLQEATNFNKLDIKMQSLSGSDSSNPIALLWDDSKYKLIKYYEDTFVPGRPILTARFHYRLFDCPLFVVNLHATT